MLQSCAGAPLHLLVGGLLESLPMAMAEFDPELRCTRSNRAFAELLALAMDELAGRSITDFPAPLPRHVAPLLHQARSGAGPVPDLELFGAFPGRPGCDTHLVIRVHALRDGGHLAGIILLLTDVTEQWQTHSELRETKLFSQRVLNSLSTFVCMLEPDGTLIEANRPPLEQAGLGLADVRGEKFWDCYWWNHDREA